MVTIALEGLYCSYEVVDSVSVLISDCFEEQEPAFDWAAVSDGRFEEDSIRKDLFEVTSVPASLIDYCLSDSVTAAFLDSHEAIVTAMVAGASQLVLKGHCFRKSWRPCHGHFPPPLPTLEIASHHTGKLVLHAALQLGLPQPRSRLGIDTDHPPQHARSASEARTGCIHHRFASASLLCASAQSASRQPWPSA